MKRRTAINSIAAHSLLTLTSGLFSSKLAAQELPAEVLQALPVATLSGRTRLKIWGFDIYDARLWVASEFSAISWGKHPLALELAYLRDFKGADIAKRSVDEMRRVASFSEEQASKWQAHMAALFPDVKRGDKLTGLYRPGSPLRFAFNGKLLGELPDPAMAEPFMAIWLSPKTSEPKMRRELLEKAAP
jgi:hypothetical protein